jgi:catechol 2,3-dioxygenase-like lactoylglutathione lyase family enzyme
MSTRLSYVISFVDDVAAATKFYREVAGFAVRLDTPQWVELETGSTTLALHPATPEAPAGTVKIGLHVPDMDAFASQLSAAARPWTRAPLEQHGMRLADFSGPGGAPISVSAPAAGRK